MTDNEIIKALECCRNGLCTDCPRLNTPAHILLCKEQLMCETLDLINRQKAENEELKEECSCLGCENEWLKAHLEQAKSEAVKEFAERLKEKFACLEYVIQTNRKTLPIERVKAEVDAVLQNGCSNVVDKILKEMVGEG